MRMKTIWKRSATLALGFIVVGLMGVSPTRARDGPLIPQHTNTPLPTSTEIPTAPPETPTPEPTPSRTPRPSSTPTVKPGIEVTANWTVRRCIPYARIAERWIMMEKSPEDDFESITLDDIPMLMAIMAGESGCDSSKESSAGAVGLFQIIPRPWIPFYGKLKQNSANIYAGIWLLDKILTKTEGDWRTTIGMWNCGEPKLLADECGSRGGYNFSDHVFSFWLPRFEEALAD